MRKFIFALLIATIMLSGCAVKEPKEKAEIEGAETPSMEQKAEKETDPPEDDIDRELIYGTCTYVIDGDTFIFQDETGAEYKVRLIGVDAPESVHRDESKNTEEGRLASEYTRRALENKTVALEFDVEKEDKYGRLLAYVWLDDALFNKQLLNDGFAYLMTIPPNVKYIDVFLGE